MKNIIKAREMLTQIRFTCLEIAHGCESLQTAPIALTDLQILTDALREMHGAAGKMLEEWQSSEIDAAKDHDGDTQPANAEPEQPVCKCGHPHRDHMPASFTAGPSGAIAAAMLGYSAGCCIFCLCERFEP